MQDFRTNFENLTIFNLPAHGELKNKMLMAKEDQKRHDAMAKTDKDTTS